MGICAIRYSRQSLGAGLLALAAATGCAQAQPALPEPVGGPDLTLQTRTVEALWEAVDESYLYEDLSGPAWEQVRDDYLERLDGDLTFDEFDMLLEEMVGELSQDTPELLTREARISRMMDNPTSAPGVIGTYLMYSGSSATRRVVLTLIIPGSPAESAGLQAHDSILAVDGTPIGELDGSAVRHIRGPVGEDVSLLVESPGEPPREVAVTRGPEITTEVGTRVILDEPADGIAHITMPPATSIDNVEELADRLLEFDAQSPDGSQGFILDLRLSNPAGWDLDTLERMVGIFGSGDMGVFYTREGETPIEIEGRDVGGSQRQPLAIIVGEETAGLPEVFSASLQATGRAAVVGPQTGGGVEFLVAEVLPNGTRVLIPAIGYRAPNGEEVGRSGIVPDVRVTARWYEFTGENDPALAAALEVVTDAIARN
jgi:C-terminal processing protease CtpA/Prc